MSVARDVSSDGQKVTSSMPVATEEYSSDEQRLSIATVESEPTFEYQVARLWNGCPKRQ
jgi:hypothetical protein